MEGFSITRRASHERVNCLRDSWGLMNKPELCRWHWIVVESIRSLNGLRPAPLSTMLSFLSTLICLRGTIVPARIRGGRSLGRNSGFWEFWLLGILASKILVFRILVFGILACGARPQKPPTAAQMSPPISPTAAIGSQHVRWTPKSISAATLPIPATMNQPI